MSLHHIMTPTNFPFQHDFQDLAPSKGEIRKKTFLENVPIPRRMT